MTELASVEAPTAPRAAPATPSARATLARRGEVLLDALRRHRRIVSLLAYGALTALAYLAAFAVHFQLGWQPGYGPTVLGSLAILVPLRLAAGHFCGLSIQRWRFAGTKDLRQLVVAVAAGTLVFALVAQGFRFEHAVPATVLVLEPIFTVLATAGLWLTYRTAFELSWPGVENGSVRNVVVVGAGEAGEALVRQMMMHPNGYRPVAFADDDPVRLGASIHGVKVLGGTPALADIARRTAADEVVIAIPSADPSVLRRIVKCCEPTGLPYRVLPPIAAVLDGDVSLAQLREVRIEDLLGRDPVELELPELTRDLAGETVLITGAAGSIGSELARQAARHRPGRLLLLDQSETGLFYLELELRGLVPDLDVLPVVADVVDATAVERVYALHGPSRVFHAAAYKHVPMMEANAREALRNNVIGTWRVAAAAGRHGVEKFVLVSTDKAVRPVNIMGATKRAAELVVLELQETYPDTVFGAVRFGNVLGSAGSVIPVFKRQLEEGKPLTVTHPDVTRYFMTIPEAAQLVLQASLLPELRGRIAMLEMGQPVRILDLARTLVRLSGGSRADESIVFTGLRPGEKLHEELVAPGEEASSTAISKVRILDSCSSPSRGVLERMPEWDHLLAAWEADPVISELFRIVPERRRRVTQGSRRKTDRPAGVTGGNGVADVGAGTGIGEGNGITEAQGMGGGNGIGARTGVGEPDARGGRTDQADPRPVHGARGAAKSRTR